MRFPRSRTALAGALIALAAPAPAAQTIDTGAGVVDGLPLGARNGVTTLGTDGTTLYAGPRLVVIGPDGAPRFAASAEAFRPAVAPEARAYSIATDGPRVWVGLGFTDAAADDPTPTAAGFAVSDDAGRTWRYRFAPSDPAAATSLVYGVSTLYAEPVVSGAFAPPYGLALAGPDVFVAAGVAGLRRSADGGATWQRLVLPPDTLRAIAPEQPVAFPVAPQGTVLPDGSRASASYNFEAYAVTADEAGTLWVGTLGGLNRSDAADERAGGQRAWRRFVTDPAAPGGSPTGNFVTAIAAQPLEGMRDPVWFATWPSPLAAQGLREEYGVTVWTGDDADGTPRFTTLLRGTIAYAFAFDGARAYVAAQDGLYASPDGGRTWNVTRVFRGEDGRPLPIRPGAPVFAVAVTGPPGGRVLWAGSAEGLLRSADGGQTWRVARANVPPRPDAPTADVPAVDVYAYPNPFAPGGGALARIRFDLPAPADVRVRVFDFGMNLVRTLEGGARPAGPSEVLWDGTTDAGTRVANGTYVYLVEAGGRRLSGRLIVLN
ncbi:MAG: FlgD immunoglobulin-like domain containing protein [Rubricoccaceae bacterium]